MVSEDYIFLLQHCPSVELMSCLTQEWNGHPPFLSLGETVLTLIDTEHKVICIRLLEDISKEGRGEHSWGFSSRNVTACTCNLSHIYRHLYIAGMFGLTRVGSGWGQVEDFNQEQGLQGCSPNWIPLCSQLQLNF